MTDDLLTTVQKALHNHVNGACVCEHEPGLTIKCVIGALHPNGSVDNWLRALMARVEQAEAEVESWCSDANRLAERCAKDEMELDALRIDVNAYRGALGYSCPGDTDERLSDGTIPVNGIADALRHGRSAEYELLRETFEKLAEEHATLRERHAAAVAENSDLRALLDEARSHNPEKYRSSSDDSGTHGAETGGERLPSPSSDWTRVAREASDAVLAEQEADHD